MKKIVLGFLLTGLIGFTVGCSCQKQQKENLWEPDQITVTNVIYVKKVVEETNTTELFIVTPTNTVIDYNKDNVVGLGFSICGRAKVSYDRLDIINFGRVGLGLGVWTTMNVLEPQRFWDFGGGINISF